MALSNSQYNDIMKVYGERQLRHYRGLQERLKECYARIPGLQALDRAVGEESVRAAEAMLAGDRSLKDGLRERLREISREKKRLLTENGFPENYLELWHDCPDCGDSGFVNGKKCHCFQSMQLRLLYRQSNVEEIVRNQNFSSFNLSIFDDRERLKVAGDKTNREYMAELRAYLLEWCRDFDKNRGNLILMGNPGTGKTFLINCITRELLDSGHSVIYLSSTDFFESLARAMRGDEEELGTAILEADLLVIDDLGTEFTNSFTSSKLFYVINQRMVLRRSVIISTNLTFRGLRDSYSDRVVSRIMSEYEIIPLYGRDQRL